MKKLAAATEMPVMMPKIVAMVAFIVFLSFWCYYCLQSITYFAGFVNKNLLENKKTANPKVRSLFVRFLAEDAGQNQAGDEEHRRNGCDAGHYAQQSFQCGTHNCTLL